MHDQVTTNAARTNLAPIPFECDAPFLKVTGEKKGTGFIEQEIAPLERENLQYFDRRREFARTDLENGGIPDHPVGPPLVQRLQSPVLRRPVLPHDQVQDDAPALVRRCSDAAQSG